MSIRTKPRTMLLDMDGVIIHSEKLHLAAEQAVCEKYNINVPPDAWATFQGKTDYAIFEEIIRAYTRRSLSPEKLIARKQAIFFERARYEVQLVNGASWFIPFTKQRVESLGLVTSTKRVYVEELIGKQFRLLHHFETTVTQECVTRGKPHPEPYLLAAERLRVEPKDCNVIEDSPNGIVSAKAAGCFVIGLTTSHSRGALREAGANATANDYNEIAGMFVS